MGGGLHHLACVSNPHRYGQKAEPLNPGIAFVSQFQTLIGTVKRAWRHEDVEGILKAFQTLIGTVKRLDLYDLAAGGFTVSNPHRYGQKGGCGGARPPAPPGFKPS